MSYHKLNVSDRMDYLKSYRKSNPKGSYRDAVSYYDKPIINTNGIGDQIELQNDENPYSYNVDNNRSLVNQDNLNYDRYLGEIEKYGEGMTPNEYNAKYTTQQDFDRWNAKKIRTYNQTEFRNGGKLDSNNKSTLDIHNTYTVPFGSDSSTNSIDKQHPSYSPYNKFTIDGSIPISKNFDVTGNLGIGQVNSKSINGEAGIQYGRSVFNNKETATKFNFNGTNIGAGIGVGDNGVYPFAESKVQMNAKLGNYKNYNTSFNFTPVDIKWTGNQNTDELHYFGLGLSTENKHNGLKIYGKVGFNQNGVFDFDHNNDPNRNYDANSTSRNGVNSIEGTIGLSKTFGMPGKKWKYKGVHDNERNLGQFAYGGSLEDGDPQGNQPNYSDSLQLYANTNALEKYYSKYKPDSQGKHENYFTIDEMLKHDMESFQGNQDNVNTPTGHRPVKLYEYYLPLDKNKFMKREGATGQLDTRAPMALFDRRIQPQYKTYYNNEDKKDVMFGDVIEIASYDPLAVKPYKLLTESEKKQRIEKYGLTGFPKDYNQPKPQVTSNVSGTGMTYNQTQTYRQSHPNANFNTNAQGLFVLAPQPQIKPIVKQEQPIPSVKEVVSIKQIPEKPKNENIPHIRIQEAKWHGDPFYWMVDKMGRQQEITKQDYERESKSGRIPVKKY